MERDLDSVSEDLDEIDQYLSDHHDPYLPSGRKISKNRSRRSLLFQWFLSYFCCNPSPKSSSMSRHSVGTVGPTPESPSPPSNGSRLGASPRSFESPFPPQNSASQSYAAADEVSFDGNISEQDSSSQNPASDSIKGDDSNSQWGPSPRRFIFPAQFSPPPAVGLPSKSDSAPPLITRLSR